MPQPAPYISNLTPIRGIAAVLVVIFHFQILFGIVVKPETSHLIGKSYLMVDLFFILSGIVMTHVYGKYFSAQLHWFSYKKFLVARFARIYPLHILTLCLVAFAVYFFGVWEMFAIPAALLPNLLLVHAVHTTSGLSWNLPSWSISAEWISYLLFPPLLPVLTKFSRVALFIIYLSILSGYWLTLHFLTSEPTQNTLQDITWNFGFLRGLLGFLSGIIIYRFYQSISVRNLFCKDVMLYITFIPALLILHWGGPDLLAITSFSLFLLSATCNAGKFKKILDWKPLQVLGDISFSIYMLHGILMIVVLIGIKYLRIPYKGFFLQNPFGISQLSRIIACVCFLATLFLFSFLSFKFVENPARAFLNRRFKASTEIPPFQISN